MGETAWRPRGCSIPEKYMGLMNCTIWNNYTVGLPTIGWAEVGTLAYCEAVSVGHKKEAPSHIGKTPLAAINSYQLITLGPGP